MTDNVFALNGKYVDSIYLPIDIGHIQLDSAINIALQDTTIENAKGKPRWLDADEDSALKEAMNDPSATYYPTLKKIWAADLYLDSTFSYEMDGSKFHLCYELPIYRIDTPSTSINCFIYFVDVFDGSIVKIESGFLEVGGTATVRFHSGTQSFDVTDRGWPNNDFYLEDPDRNFHTKDYGSHYATWWRHDKVTDDDGNWGTDDQFATSIHFFYKESYDYFSVNFNRQGWDDHSPNIRLYTNFNTPGYTDGTVTVPGSQEVYFATTDGNYVAGIDVVGHEFTHGVINRTSGMGGTQSSRICQEGICDIFGIMIEREFEGSAFDWDFNEDESTRLRTAEDPVTMDYPIVYHGTNWCFPTESCLSGRDQEHHNSTVISHWFYVLCEGNGGSFMGIDQDQAAYIVYSAVTEYCTENSLIQDFRDATINVAKMMYGECSDQHNKVLLAWTEVGLASGSPCPTTSVEEINYSNFVLYPNPSKNKVILRHSSGYSNFKVNIVNTLGQVLDNVTMQNRSNLIEVDVCHLSEGTYFFILTDEFGTKVYQEKFVKLK